MLRFICSVILLIILVGCSNSEHKKAAKDENKVEPMNIDSILPFSITNDLFDIKLPDSVAVSIKRDHDDNVIYCGIQYTSDSLLVAALSKKTDTILSIDFISDAQRIHEEFKSKLMMRLGEIKITADSILSFSKQTINGKLSGEIDDDLDFVHYYSMDTSFIHQLHLQFDSISSEHVKYIIDSYTIKK